MNNLQREQALTILQAVIETDFGPEQREKLQAIRARSEDPFLNLAVIGDFSSGKSTFLNALMRRELLATDLQPTPRCPPTSAGTWPGGRRCG